MIDDLPEPVGPSSAITWPGCASRETSSSTVVPAEVAERDVLEAHVTRDGRQRRRVRRVLDLGLRIEDLEDAFAGRRGHRDGGQDHAQAAHRLDQQAQVGGEGDQLAQGQAAAARPACRRTR